MSETLQARTGLDLDALYAAEERSRALIVDDDPDVVGLLKLSLRNAGIDVVGAYGGFEAVRKCADTKPDVVLLDLMMPDVDGWETLKLLRQIGNIPVVVVSAKGTSEDVIQGLNAGVDDYVPKPFKPGEVVARVKAVLRRARSQDGQPLKKRAFPQVGVLIDFETREIFKDGDPIQLPPKAFAVLEILARHAPRPVPYSEIAEKVWGEDTPKILNRIKYTILIIRRQLEDDPSNPQLVLNRTGLGYQLNTRV